LLSAIPARGKKYGIKTADERLLSLKTAHASGGIEQGINEIQARMQDFFSGSFVFACVFYPLPPNSADMLSGLVAMKLSIKIKSLFLKLSRRLFTYPGSNWFGFMRYSLII